MILKTSFKAEKSVRIIYSNIEKVYKCQSTILNQTYYNMLLVREGIEYIDITPYNFIELNNKIYLIDFGHARFRTKSKSINWFLKRFLFDMINEYNPDFR